MKANAFNVRNARLEDTGLILQMIRELADFEQLLDQVVTDEETLKHSLFNDPKGPEVLIAEENNQPVGFVLFFHNFSTFLGRKGIYIEDLYVRSEYRGKGYGELILKEICELAKKRNCDVLNGGCSIGMSEQSTFIRKLELFRCPIGLYFDSRKNQSID